MISKGALKSFGANFLTSAGILDLLWNREPSWRILMYHRVCNPEELPYPVQAGMYVRPETFHKHCQFFKRHSEVIPVEDLIIKLNNMQ